MMHPVVNAISLFFQSEFFRQSILIAQIVSFVLILYFLISIIYFVRKSGYLRYRFTQDATEILTFSAAAAKKSEKQWLVIKKKLESSSESEWKLAITEAESLLDETLKRAGFAGDSFGEKIQNIKADQLKNIDSVKKVHEIRNNIVHNPDYVLTLEEAKKVLEVYERSLRDLGLF